MGEIIFVPYWEFTPEELRRHRLAAIRYLKEYASKTLKLPLESVIVRDLIVGDEDAGDTSNLPVDIQDAPAGTEQRTNIRGWAQDASDLTAETLDLIYDDAVHDDQVIGIIGVMDLTGAGGVGSVSGDVTYIRMKDKNNIKAFFNFQRAYLGDLPGGVFIDQDTGNPAVIIWDENDQLQIEVAVINASVDHQLVFEAYVAEKAGAVLTATKSPVV